ncbi:MAG: hypothetical protein HN348_05260, partial [Proteobacteria bacterium]|nr:hypothetical protein [Pseudomonadota bacterium]
YADCLVTDADDSDALFGHALTELLLMPNWTPLQESLTMCNQPTDAVAQVYGPKGLLQEATAAQEGSGSIDVSFKEGSNTVDLTDVFDNGVGVVVTSIDYDDWFGEDMLTVDMAEDIGYWDDLYFYLSMVDVYDNDSNVALEEGLVIDVSKWNYANDFVWFSVDCGTLGSWCDGDEYNDTNTGTITLTKFDATPGADIQLDFDLVLGAHCYDYPCNASHHVVGSITDVVSEPLTTDGLPFDDATWICDVEDCDDWAFMSEVAEQCDLANFAKVNDLALQMAAQFNDIAAEFGAAGENADLQYTIGPDNIIILDGDFYANQTDARGLAAAAYGAAASLELLAQYNVLDPAAKPEDLVGNYKEEWEDSGLCVEDLVYGVDIDTREDQLNSHLGTPASAVDFAGAETGFITLIETTVGILEAEPTKDGVFDFTTNNQDIKDWREAIITDLMAIHTSLLNGSTVPLPSSQSYNITIGEWFATPPVMDDFYQDEGFSNVTERGGYCDQYIELRWELGDWAIRNGILGIEFPDSMLEDNDCDTDSNCEVDEYCEKWWDSGQLEGYCWPNMPSILADTDALNQVFDTDVPYFFNEDVLDIFPMIED